MTQIDRSALVPYSAHQMFALVNDVAAYPQYMDGCQRAQVLEQGDGFMVARLDLQRAKLKQSLVTRNRLQDGQRIDMELVEGPFTRFKGVWSFDALREDACKISLSLEFDVSNRLLRKAVEGVFNPVANQMVDALCRRARQVYG